MDFDKIKNDCLRISNHIRKNKKLITGILTKYETKIVAEDEIERVLDLLEHIEENSSYFKGVNIRSSAVFLPSNQPLYAFFCFAVIPSFQSNEVNVRLPKNMKSFFMDLMDSLNLKENFNNINVLDLPRDEFLSKVTATELCNKSNKKIPKTDVVIFTGREENAINLKKKFSKETLFIFNGSGHNPVVVTKSANIKKAVDSVLNLQLYNQGQDCAAPNAILVDSDVYSPFMKLLQKKLKKVKTGPYSKSDTIIGPITRGENLENISKFLIKNYEWIDDQTNAGIDFKTKIIKPVIISRELKKGGNYNESFAPIFFIQKYDNDDDLKLYFNTEEYKKNAMYLTIFGYSNYIESKENDLDFKSKYGILIKDTNLHAKGVERGINEYGGYAKGASSLSLNEVTIPMPTLPQRDIYNVLISKEWSSKFLKANCDNLSKNKEIMESKPHWSIAYADNVIDRFPNREEYVFAAGISPSGTIHFGNFRDIVTSYAPYLELKKRGKKARIIFSWDDYDRFRKVPMGIDSSFEEYIGMPLSKVPSPDGSDKSYAKYHEEKFEKAMKALDIEIEYIYQTDEYNSGRYDEYIIKALQNREKIAKILLSFMTEKGKENKSIVDQDYIDGYYPIAVYSNFSGKDNTRVIDYDGDKKITYKCYDSGKTETIDITKDRVVKLAWKVDWAMRWGVENVSFEPGGKDHSSAGGSYDTSTVIAREIFGVEPPVYQGYDFVGIRGLGDKMSGSKGNSISPEKLLDIYSPELLKWLYFKADPSKTFSLAFDSEVYRQYAEFDRKVESIQLNGDAHDDFDIQALEISGVSKSDKYKKPIPFRQAVGYGQIVQWNEDSLIEILEAQEESYDRNSIKTRLKRAKSWLETYNKDEVLELLREKNISYIAELSEKELISVRELRKKLIENPNSTIQELNTMVYGIVKDENLEIKENAKNQKLYFKIIYNLLIAKNSGPRLSTFLWAIEDRDTVLELLNV